MSDFADHIKLTTLETERLERELDITNADHIALWLEANVIPHDALRLCLSWLSVQIVEAHERAIDAPICPDCNGLGYVGGEDTPSSCMNKFHKLALSESFERVAKAAKERDAFNEQMALRDKAAKNIGLLCDALQKCASYIQSPLRMSSDSDEALRRAALLEKAREALAKANSSDW